MKSAVIIPTYWSSNERLGTPGSVNCYDHATPIEAEKPQLDACLASLSQVAGLGTVIILVVAPPEVEERAVHRVNDMVSAHGIKEAIIVDSFKAMAAASKIADIVPEGIGEPVSLRGYGAIRNMGLLACCALGCDVAVFLDDDETVLDENFLINAVYAFGQVSRQGLPIMAKSGYFLDRRNSALADRRQVKFYDKFWAKRAEFNEWMTQALAGPRISRSNTLCGGCFAVHAEAYTRVSFDPWITRGEDLDYLFDLRLYGVDVWFDNKWRVRHTPPRIKDTAFRFLQDVYRWTYERRKLEVCNSNIDLQKLTPEALMPYPGPWISAELPTRIRKTAFWRALMTSEHGAYWRVFKKGRKQAVEYAEQYCDRYLDFQPYWSEITQQMWLDEEMARVLQGPGMLNADIAARMARRGGSLASDLVANAEQAVAYENAYEPSYAGEIAEGYDDGLVDFAPQAEQAAAGGVSFADAGDAVESFTDEPAANEAEQTEQAAGEASGIEEPLYDPNASVDEQVDALLTSITNHVDNTPAEEDVFAEDAEDAEAEEAAETEAAAEAEEAADDSEVAEEPESASEPEPAADPEPAAEEPVSASDAEAAEADEPFDFAAAMDTPITEVIPEDDDNQPQQA